MKRPSSLLNVIAVLVVSVPLLYLAATWSSIPAIIPIHYDIHMKPNQLAAKSELWIPTLILAGCSLLVYIIMRNINKIDPKRAGSATPASFKRMSLVIVAFISLLNLLMVMICSSSGRVPATLIITAIGLLLAAIGNYLPALKPNYFAGIRFPWTLNSESNWRKTHQLAGKLWFWGGLLLALVSLFLPAEAKAPLLIATVAVLVLIPGIYSWRLFKKEKTTQS